MMSLKKARGKAWGLLVVLITFGLLVMTMSYYSYGQAKIENTDSTWYEDAGGYHKALALQDETGKPLFVYVYAPWCPYCKQFNKEVLSTPEVQQYLASYIKVKIYPGDGLEEKAIAGQLGTQGYPSLYLKFPVNPVYYTVSRLVQHDGQWALATPSEFIQKLEALTAQGVGSK